MVFPSKVDVFCSLHDTWAEVLVGVAYCDFRVSNEPIIGMLLAWEKVASAAAWNEQFSDGSAEVFKAL